jgi:hypothetical protein
MFNSPILDVTIGLVFIFLLYSLLATSVNEAIATSFSLRARMLRNAITEHMLADSLPGNRWGSMFKGTKDLFVEIFKIITGYEKKKDKKKVGDHFYQHPLIKNYGSSSVFPLPSYIHNHNFSTVLIDVLKGEFEKRLEEIAQFKYERSSTNEPLDRIREQLMYGSDMVKVKELLDYYGRHYTMGAQPIIDSVIDKDTWKILDMHMRESMYDFQKFVMKVETWFDDTMDRVSGWYKRQTQVVLLLLGFSIALGFNVDAIQIVGKLSTDKDTRERMVDLAVQATETYKDDPRVQQPSAPPVTSTLTSADTADDSRLIKEYKDRIKSIDSFVKDTLQEVNSILALGWDEGKKEVAKQTKGKKFIGFLITAFAISLGAPFWFDLLNKFVLVRGTGKREGNGNGGYSGTAAPVIVQLTNQTGEEAVG